MKRPAVLGGPPAFPGGLAFARPATPELARVMGRLTPSWEAGQLTNGPLVRELEERAAERLGVRHVVAVSCCTDGLMLALRAVLLASGRTTAASAVLPSFTFSATGHAVSWNGARPIFAECDPSTFQVDAGDLRRQAATHGASVLMATHIFGAPCRAEALEALAASTGAALVLDAAHAFGAVRQGRKVGGFGDAEVFSMSPTKVLVAGEGGLVSTNRDDIAEAIRIGRDYGNPGDYDTTFAGLNARLSELHAAVALESLAELDHHLAVRQRLARRYAAGLVELPGVACQVVEPGDVSAYKDFTITIDPDGFGLTRDCVRRALAAEGIDTRCYFDPPVHRQKAYARLTSDLPITDMTSSRVLSLPMWSALAPASVDTVIDAFASLVAHAEAVRAEAVGAGQDASVPAGKGAGPRPIASKSAAIR